jgi:hypothetical protein
MSRARVTHGVVTPNIVAPTSGASPASSSPGPRAPAIPAIAAAALPSTRREIRFNPARSTTGYISVTSDSPT